MVIKKINKKKAIGPIVAISLLIVVAVVGVFTFQTWFSGFSGNIQNKAEFNSNNQNLNIELNLVQKKGNNLNLFLQNPSQNIVFIKQIKIDDTLCSLVSSNTLGIKTVVQVEVSNCGVSKGTRSNVFIQTNLGIFESYILVK